MKLIEETNEAYVVHYESIQDLMESSVNPVNEYYVRRSYECHARDLKWWGWSGGFEECKRKLSGAGWPEGLEMARRELPSVAIPTMRSVKRKRVRASHGDTIDMQRVYSGDLARAWETTHRFHSASKGSNNVIIVIDPVASASVESTEAFWRGAAAVMIADMLMQSGRSVKIVVGAAAQKIFTDRHRRMKSSFTMTIKEFDQPLDMETMALVTSVGFFRGYGLKAYAEAPYPINDYFGYPGTVVLHSSLVNDLSSLVIKVNSGILTKAQAVHLLNSVAAKFDSEVLV